MINCLACGHANSKPLFNPGPQPLAALNLPTTTQEAQDSLRLPMNFHICKICGHVWNVDFEYAKVPYAGDANLMYNRGKLWQSHLDTLIAKLVANTSMWIDQPIIDIGCGDGMFFSKLLVEEPKAQCIGFEPGVEGKGITDFKCVQDYFIPERDLKKYKPNLIICRHVLEHLENPREFIAEIAYWSVQYDINPVFLAETPCFYKGLSAGRVSDFLYEHVSNFTIQSLYTLFITSGFKLLETTTLYDDEVVVGFFQPQREALLQNKRVSEAFNKKVSDSFESVKATKQELDNVVLWGGTGKSAAFINMFGFDADKFPIVVDSDINKHGKYVPGTGQVIISPEQITGSPVIIITTPWRTVDIMTEIQMREIKYSKVLVLNEGQLNEYTPL